MGKHKLSEQDSDYPCKYVGCKRHYKSKFSLRRHCLSHMNDRRHRCPYCSKGFALAQYLREHIHIHTGAKPFVCPHPGCGKQFRQAGKLSIHRKEHNSLNSPSTNDNRVCPADEALSNLYAVRAVFEQLKNLTIPEFFFTKVLPLPPAMKTNEKMLSVLQQDPMRHQERVQSQYCSPPTSPTFGMGMKPKQSYLVSAY